MEKLPVKKYSFLINYSTIFYGIERECLIYTYFIAKKLEFRNTILFFFRGFNFIIFNIKISIYEIYKSGLTCFFVHVILFSTREALPFECEFGCVMIAEWIFFGEKIRVFRPLIVK